MPITLSVWMLKGWHSRLQVLLLLLQDAGRGDPTDEPSAPSDDVFGQQEQQHEQEQQEQGQQEPGQQGQEEQGQLFILRKSSPYVAMLQEQGQQQQVTTETPHPPALTRSAQPRAA